MLDLTRVSGASTIELPLHADFTNPTESGLAYIRVAHATTGEEVVKPATGAASETFVGIAYLDKHAGVYGTKADYAVTVPAASPYTVTLPDSGIYGIVGTLNTVTGSALVYDASADASLDYSISGSVVTFHSSDAGKTVYLTYNYTLTTQQLQQLGISPVASAAATTGTIAIMKGSGELRAYVTNFVPDTAWAVNDDVLLGGSGSGTTSADGTAQLNGFFAKTSSSGVTVGKCFHAPTALDPYLGVEFNY